MKAIAFAFLLASLAVPAVACTATKAEFDKIQTGMSYAQVVQIIGCGGELLSESEIAGYVTVMLMWQGKGTFGANMNAMFQNGKLVMKAQHGLR